MVFLAEMGDKSQLLAMTFATKYKLKIVIPGVFIGILLNHGLAVLVGNYISRFIPLIYISYIAAFVFLLFGFFSLKTEEEEDEEEVGSSQRGPIATIAITFFLGEFGDKTQITAMTLASEAANPFIILVGTVSAMMLTSILGIFIGMKIGKKVPEKIIKMVSSIIFIFFGLAKLYSLAGWTNLVIAVFVIAILLEFVLLVRFHRQQEEIDALQLVADRLYQQNKLLSSMTETICKGQASCGVCQGEACMIGYVKVLLNENKKMDVENFNEKDIATLINKGYGEEMVLSALSLILSNYIRYDFWKNENPLNREVRKVFEMILFNRNVEYQGDSDLYFNELEKENKVKALKLKELTEERISKNKNKEI